MTRLPKNLPLSDPRHPIHEYLTPEKRTQGAETMSETRPRTEKMLRPSQWPVGRTYNSQGESTGVDAWIKGGVRIWTLGADGTMRYAATSGRRQYRVFVEEAPEERTQGAETMTPEIRKIIRRDVVRHGSRMTVWVGLGRPTAEQLANDDYECPTITHEYVSRAALVAAIASGSAFADIR